MDYLNCLASRYSDRTQTIDIGNSVEGRAIKVIKIGRPRANGSVKPAIWIDGGIHAREWISPATVEYLVHQLVTNIHDAPENKNLVENFDIYVLPILNQDGYATCFGFSELLTLILFTLNRSFKVILSFLLCIL